MSNHTQKRKQRFKVGTRAIASAILVLLVIAAGLVVSNILGRAQATALGPATVLVTRGRIVGSVSGSGAIAAEQTVDLSFQTSGVVKTVAAAAGDHVQAGQVLADLDTNDLQLALANAQTAFNQQQARFDQMRAGASEYDLATAQANVESAQANYDAAVRKANVNDSQLAVARAQLDKATLALQKAQSDYDIAVAEAKPSDQLKTLAATLAQVKIDYSSAMANYNIQVASINDSSVRSAAAALASAKATLAKLQNSPTVQDLQIAQAQLEQAKIALQQAQLRLRNAQLSAPFAGVIMAVNIAPGSSASSALAAIKLMDRSTLHVNLRLNENDVAKVEEGQAVDLSMDSLSGWKAQGILGYIAPAAETSNGVVTYAVRVNFADSSPKVRVGLTANVTIITAQKADVLLVPNSALLPKGAGHIVQVLDANGKARDVDVETGISDGAQTEIVSGVGEGTPIVALPGTAQRPASPFGN